ncbi:DNA alkylation repair protein [Candidatus Saccharibacteria bacterium]|jgi:3-methyladenine DNA glycosylase AlkD|nr:DNA alkylation repair protein [Candidatus Saccharibacteria bacterium]
MNSENVKRELAKFNSSERAQTNRWFFKTLKGQYGEFDKFIGVSASQIRVVAKNNQLIELSEIKKLFQSPIHEHRLTAAILLTYQYDVKVSDKREIFDFYLEIVRNHTTVQIAPDYKVEIQKRTGVDAWDIVDSSAHKIVGQHLIGRNTSMLYELANNPNLWQNRVAMISTWWPIVKYDIFDDALKLAEIFLNHPHDLIQKASGWMLREVGKKDDQVLRGFLDKHIGNLSRTTLRYAIERLPKKDRKSYLLAGKS